MKTLGTQTGRLLESLHDSERTTFKLDDAVKILGTPRNITSNLLAKAEKRGVVTRLQRGLYVLVPFEMGSEPFYAGHPQSIVARMLEGQQFYFSHATAMSMHSMTRQPQILVTASCEKPPRRRMTAAGTEIQLVAIKKDEIFGLEKYWTADHKQVPVSDIERTIVDCLRRLDLCGGYVELDAGAWMVRDKIDADKLVDYALRLGVGAVIARTGFLLDSCKLGSEKNREQLKQHIKSTYCILDPLMPPDGRYLAEWKLRLNVDQEEIEAIRSS